METKFDFDAHFGGQDADAEKPLVYVKSVAVSDLPREVRAAAGDLDQLFAVHNSDGEQLALVADRDMAFVLARRHDMQPVTVH